MWPPQYSELKAIETLLTCGICYEYLETSVITPCSHNYCSLCIRKYLHYKTSCPSCFEETFEKDLRRNKILDEILLQYKEIKPKLEPILHEKNIREQIFAGTSSPASKSIFSQNVDQKDKILLDETCKTVENKSHQLKYLSSPSYKELCRDVNSPSTSMAHKVHALFTPKRKKQNEDIEKHDLVSCPVCGVEIPDININRHLDDCLKRDSTTHKPQKNFIKRKPLPKLVFKLMKDTEIRKKLKEYKLPTQGDKKILEARLQKYITLYNAECDKDDPRPIAHLIKQCEDEENVEKKVQRTLVFNKFQVNKNTEKNVLEQARKKYLEENKDSFANLIANMKKMESSKHKSATGSVFDQDTSSDSDYESAALVKPDTDISSSLLTSFDEEIGPISHQLGGENLPSTSENTSKDYQSFSINEMQFQDYDSDSNCPLQNYQRNDSNLNEIETSSPASLSNNDQVDSSITEELNDNLTRQHGAGMHDKINFMKKEKSDLELNSVKIEETTDENSILPKVEPNVLHTSGTKMLDGDVNVTQTSTSTNFTDDTPQRHSKFVYRTKRERRQSSNVIKSGNTSQSVMDSTHVEKENIVMPSENISTATFLRKRSRDNEVDINENDVKESRRTRRALNTSFIETKEKRETKVMEKRFTRSAASSK